MKVGYVVLYVQDTELCRAFWIDRVGMIEKKRTEAGAFTIVQVGFADQDVSFELVPLEMASTNERLAANGVQVTEVGEHHGMANFAFSDPEGRWFAVTR